MGLDAGPYAAILDRFENVEDCSWGWKCRCPAHDDNKNSLSVQISKRDGRLLMKCHAGSGCTFPVILGAIGVNARDCFPPTNGKRTNGMGRIVKTYDYVDEHGALVFQVVRFEPKDFRQRRKAREGDPPDTVKNGWVWSVKDVRRYLYRLDILAKADSERAVFVVEGEKDVDKMIGMGFVATTCSGGAGKWHLSDASILHGRNVVIVPDNDPPNNDGQRPGWDHAIAVAMDLLGNAVTVRIIELPGLGPKEDISDWFDTHDGTSQKLQELIKGTPLFLGTQECKQAKTEEAKPPEAKKPPPTIRVTLDSYEMQLAAQVGMQRKLESMRKRSRNRTRDAADDDRIDTWGGYVEGAAAELAFAKWKGVAWRGGFSEGKESGVDGVQVRLDSRLCVGKDAADDQVFVLMSGSGDVYDIVGWCRGCDAKQEKWLAGSGQVYLVPREELKEVRKRGK